MHELGIVTAMLREATREAEMRSARRISRLRCRVGVLRGIDEALLREAFHAARKDTPARDATLDVDTVLMRYVCPACGETGDSRDILLECPRCDAGPVRMRGGDELELDSMDIEVDDEDRCRSKEPAHRQ